MLPAFSDHLNVGDAISSKNFHVINKLSGPVKNKKLIKADLTRSAEEFSTNLRLSEIAILIHVEDKSSLLKNIMLNIDEIEPFINFFKSDGKHKIFVFFEHVTTIKECEYSVTEYDETEADTLVSKVEYGVSLLLSLTRKKPFTRIEDEIKIGEKINRGLYHLLSGNDTNLDNLFNEGYTVNVIKNWTQLIVNEESLDVAFDVIRRHLESENETIIRYNFESFNDINEVYQNYDNVNFMNLIDLFSDIKHKKNEILKITNVDYELPIATLTSDHHDLTGLLKIIQELISHMNNSQGVTKKTYLEVLTVTELIILYLKEEFINILNLNQNISKNTLELTEKTCLMLDILNDKLIKGNYIYESNVLYSRCNTVDDIDKLYDSSIVIVFESGINLEELKEWYSYDVLWASLNQFDFNNELILQRIKQKWLGFGWIKHENIEPIINNNNDTIYIQYCPENLNGYKRLWRCYECESPIKEKSKGILICNCGSFTEKNALYKCLRRNHLDFIKFNNNNDKSEDVLNKKIKIEKETKQKKINIYEDESNGLTSPLSKKYPINILFVGPKNSGKSTLINSIAYYCTHFHFNNENHNIPQIPFKFIVNDVDGKEYIIQSKGELDPVKGNLRNRRMSTDGTEEVELIDRTGHEPGRDHDFFWLRQYFRLFDTKGIDTDNIDDSINDIKNVLNKLNNEIHGLFIILPGINTMDDINKWYFILSKNIPIDLFKNAYYIFTGINNYENNLNYKLFTKFMRKNWINVEWDKFYAIDNSCFLYLCAKYAGIELPKMEFDQKEAWWNSRSQIVNIISKIAYVLPVL